MGAIPLLCIIGQVLGAQRRNRGNTLTYFNVTPSTAEGLAIYETEKTQYDNKEPITPLLSLATGSHITMISTDGEQAMLEWCRAKTVKKWFRVQSPLTGYAYVAHKDVIIKDPEEKLSKLAQRALKAEQLFCKGLLVRLTGEHLCAGRICLVQEPTMHNNGYVITFGNVYNGKPRYTVAGPKNWEQLRYGELKSLYEKLTDSPPNGKKKVTLVKELKEKYQS